MHSACRFVGLAIGQLEIRKNIGILALAVALVALIAPAVRAQPTITKISWDAQCRNVTVEGTCTGNTPVSVLLASCPGGGDLGSSGCSNGKFSRTYTATAPSGVGARLYANQANTGCSAFKIVPSCGTVHMPIASLPALLFFGCALAAGGWLVLRRS